MTTVEYGYECEPCEGTGMIDHLSVEFDREYSTRCELCHGTGIAEAETFKETEMRGAITSIGSKRRAVPFTLNLRDQLILSQALAIAARHLRALEDREEMYPKDGEHAEPSNRKDMERLICQEPFVIFRDMFNR